MSSFPPLLKPGDTIGVFAPGIYANEPDIAASTAFCNKKGFDVYVHPQTRERLHQSAGTSAQKAKALHDLYSDDGVHAIWALRGGNRVTHFLNLLDPAIIKANPKPIIGFSDCTALFLWLYEECGIMSYHGPVFRQLPTHHDAGAAIDFLSLRTKTIHLKDCAIIQSGVAEGALLGGNLSVFESMIGTPGMPDIDGAILFFEDCNEELSRIDRSLLHLKRAGILRKASALIFGEFQNMMDTGIPFGFAFHDILAEHCAGLKIPIIMNAPFGHGDRLPILPIGAKVNLSTEENLATLNL